MAMMNSVRTHLSIYIYVCVIVFTDCRATARFSARSRGGLRVATVGGAAELRDGRGGAVRRERRLVQRVARGPWVDFKQISP
jgi:hypothetical protein